MYPPPEGKPTGDSFLTTPRRRHAPRTALAVTRGLPRDDVRMIDTHRAL